VLRQQACKQVLRAPATCMASAATARPDRQMQGKQGTLQAPAGLLLSARRRLQRPATVLRRTCLHLESVNENESVSIGPKGACRRTWACSRFRSGLSPISLFYWTKMNLSRSATFDFSKVNDSNIWKCQGKDQRGCVYLLSTLVKRDRQTTLPHTTHLTIKGDTC
jgi:hypothetical protein